MTNFQKYLTNKGFAKNTVESNNRYADFYLDWLDNESLVPEIAGYNDVLVFIDYCRNQGKSKNNINRIMIAIRHYYNYLQISQKDIKNPAAGIRIKGIRRRLPHDLLSTEELRELYEKYETTDIRTARNKAILGLLIRQALSTAELQKLRPEYIQLRKGKLLVPSTARTNSRTLKLETSQIIDLHEYINTIRPEILKEANTQTIKLFTSMNGSENLKNTLLHLFRALKKINPDVKNAKQIRMSVISLRLKNSNLREVQHFASHKHISSTERYKTNNLDKLKKNLDKFHPLGNL